MIVADHRLQIDREMLADFCRRHHIKKLALFGSVLRDDFTEDSDIDVLVEFEEGKTPGLAFFSLPEELESMFGRKVDLLTPAGLSKYFRDEVLAYAQVIYEA